VFLRFILSKGHAAPILYAAWAEAGLFPASDLLNLRKISEFFLFMFLRMGRSLPYKFEPGSLDLFSGYSTSLKLLSLTVPLCKENVDAFGNVPT
jgi:hypothetical protein